MYIVYGAAVLRWSLRAIVVLSVSTVALAVARRLHRRSDPVAEPEPAPVSTTMG